MRVGGLTRPELQSALAAAGVRLNASAETLLDNPMFASPEVETVEIVECTVGQLGLINGATLPRIMASAREQGLMLCPPITGPYLRLSMPDQPIAPDSVMSNGRPPRGAVHVASERLRDSTTTRGASTYGLWRGRAGCAVPMQRRSAVVV